MLLAALCGMGAEIAAQAQGPVAQCVRIEAYVRGNSEQSQRAVEYLAGFEKARPGVRVDVHDVEKDPEALKRLNALSARFGVQSQIPTIHAAGRIVVGFRDAATSGPQVEELLTIRAFMREGCPRCAGAKPFLPILQQRYPGMRVLVHETTSDPNAMPYLQHLASWYGIQGASVPAFYAGGQLFVGYNGYEITGRQIEALLDSMCGPCRPPAAAGPSTSATRTSPGRSRFAHAVLPLVIGWTALPPPPAQAEGGPPGGSSPPVVPAPTLTPPPPPPGGGGPGRDTTAAEDAELPGEAPLPAEAPLPGGSPGLLPGEAPVPGQVLMPKREAIAPPADVRVPWLGKLDVGYLGMPAFTILIGLVDGFNPCAMWVLIFLLSVLVGLNDRRKIVLIAGTFVLVSGLAYFAFMAMWLEVWRLVGYARPAQLALGVMAILIGLVHIKDFFAFKRGLSLSIPESAKSGLYSQVRKIVTAKNLFVALVGAITLAVLVNVVELLCTAGLPAVYTQILNAQGYPGWKRYAYLGLYNLAYMFDDALMLTVVVVTLSRRRLQEREGRWLKLFSGVVILALGMLLVFRPELLV